ncbi:MAG: NADH dehydrogenase (quinone) subunit D [Acidimicrobiia bacterium]|nr:NADH dehydrogenase (quinone) subunit D [Acidimicrobiia bacterium]
MANPPDLATGDTTAPKGAELVEPQEPSGDVERERRQTLDIWVSGTEEPEWVTRSTSEGAQEMLEDESAAELAEQRGTLVDDDYVLEGGVDPDEIQILNMGPQHPATHGVLRLQLELEGEKVLRVKPIIGYLHTGMEKTGEVLTYMQGPTNVTRMDYLAPFFNELAFSLATEDMLGIEIPPRAQAIRVLMTELNRIASHLLQVATQGMDLGAVSMMLYGWRERELLLAFFEKTTGLRMNHNYIRPGGVAADLPDGWQDDVAEILEVIPSRVPDYEDLLTENPIFKERTQGVGVITPEECLALGITGPTARSAGIKWDLRKAFPYSGIEQFEFDVPTGRHGDVYDRYRLRIAEIYESLKIVEQVANAMPSGDYRTEDRKVTPPPRARIDESMEALIHHFKIFTEGFKVPAGETYAAVESPRGELGVYMVSDGSAKPWRMHVRGPSFANLQAVPVMGSDSIIGDLVATVASLDPIMGDVDR